MAWKSAICSRIKLKEVGWRWGWINETLVDTKRWYWKSASIYPWRIGKILDAVRERHHRYVQNRFLKARDQYVRFRFCPSGEDALNELNSSFFRSESAACISRHSLVTPWRHDNHVGWPIWNPIYMLYIIYLILK
jgi:hypothetical protein